MFLKERGFIIHKMIKISLNKELDYETYADFWNFLVAGVDFGKKIKKDHPDINLKNYKKYIDDFYVAHLPELLKKQEQINQFLKDKQNSFFIAAKNIFGARFNDNLYQGYLSIFNCNPRYPDTKTFQIYYKKDSLDMLEVALHESLHFLFFDYYGKNLLKKRGLNKNSGPLWELSEIFNVIILNLPEFRLIIEREEKLFYPDLKDKYKKILEFWDNKKSLDKFFENSLLYLVSQC